MLTFIKCEKAGLTNEKDKKICFFMSAADGKTYEFAITSDQFIRLFAMGWQAAGGLGETPTSGESISLKTQASFAITNMLPSLVLMSGPLVLSIPLGPDEIAVLQDGIRTLSEWDKGQSH